MRTNLLLLTSPKCDLDEVDKAIIQVVECHFEVILCYLSNRKCKFFKLKKATIQMVEWHLKFIDCLLTTSTLTLVRSRKRYFKWSQGTGNTFSSS